MEEEKIQVVVIDEGMEEDAPSGVRSICCLGPLFPFRG
jgi:hypothetical protein